MKNNKQYWLIFHNDLLLIDESNHEKLLTNTHINAITKLLTHKHRLLLLEDGEIFCAELNATIPIPSGLTAMPLRKALDMLGSKWYNIVTKAYAIINWDKNHRYCGRCGTSTETKAGMFERLCTKCGLTFYPRISPSIIVLISRGNDILMARSPQFAPGVFGLIAGFVEAGERAEDAVHREVKEEVGISIKNLRYFGSQSWPFPDSLMLGFTAEYHEGQLVIDKEEIETAGWYHYDNLPGRPTYQISMAHKLIEHFIVSKRS